MAKEDLIVNNPLRVLKPGPEAGLPDHRMGLIVARAGLGKTSILVQIAMDCLLRGRKVLHVTIGEGLDKTRAWYDDVFNHLAAGLRPVEAAGLYNEMLRQRMIMTFKVSSFSRPKLEERLNDLIYQNIFRPDCMVVDGFDFARVDRAAVEDLKELMKAMDMHVWFSAVCHHEDTRKSEAGVPAPCHEMDDLFDTVINLLPEPGRIELKILKDCPGCAEPGASLNLDPSTLMVKAT